MLMLREIIDRHGIPMAERAYSEPESLEEQLRGRRDPRVRQGVAGIRPSCPYTAGQGESGAWDTFWSLRRHSYLRDAPGPATIQSARHRTGGPAPGVSLDAVLCKYLRTVANDNTVPDGAALQVLPDGLRATYARARVEVLGWTAASWSSIRAGAWLRPLHPLSTAKGSTLQRAVVGYQTTATTIL